MSKDVKKHNINNRQEGFTIVELMIATVVFSLVLLVCSMAIIHVGRMYYKGVIMSRTQDVARKVLDDVVLAVQFDGHMTTSRGSQGSSRSICIGKNRYTFDTTKMRGDVNDSEQSLHVLWRDSVSTSSICNPVDLSLQEPSSFVINSNGSFGQELLGKNMRIAEFEADRDSLTGVWTILVTVSYGSQSDFVDPGVYKICKGTDVGGQFCAVSSYTTKVKGRL